MTYWNNRLLRRDVPASYKGVTHEYLDVRAGKTRNLQGISFIDHGTGSIALISTNGTFDC